MGAEAGELTAHGLSGQERGVGRVQAGYDALRPPDAAPDETRSGAGPEADGCNGHYRG